MKSQQAHRMVHSHSPGARVQVLTLRSASGSTKRVKQISSSSFSLALLLVLSGALLICGFYLLQPLFISPLSKVWQASTWSKTQCRIENIEMIRRGRVTYQPKVNYTYSINGQGFTGSTFQFNTASWLLTKSQADRFVNRYSHGHHVPCFVNPTALEQSVVQRSFTSTLLFELLIIGSLLGLPAVLLLRLPYQFVEKHFHCLVESHLSCEVQKFQTRVGNILNSGAFWKLPFEAAQGLWLLVLLSPWIARILIMFLLIVVYLAWIASIATS